MVATTRSITWRSERSRWAEPSSPRKYFWATMLVAFSDQPTGNSTSGCSKAIEPSFQLVMRASRRSQTTSSYGSMPGDVNSRLMPIRPLAGRPVAESRSGASDMCIPSGGRRDGRSVDTTSSGWVPGCDPQDTTSCGADPFRDSPFHQCNYTVVKSRGRRCDRPAARHPGSEPSALQRDERGPNRTSQPLPLPNVAPPPARLVTLRTWGCGTEGDNSVN